VAGSLVLVGFMGAGKSSALPDVLDTDRLLEDQLGMSIASFFAAYGEEKFRRREESVVLRALRSGAPVVALGGGSLGSEAVRAALASHTVVWLEVSAETAWQRVVGEDPPPGGRPPAAGGSSAAGRAPAAGGSSAAGRAPAAGGSSAAGRAPAAGGSSAAGRASAADRPLAADREAFFALHAAREPVYAAAADAFLPEGDPELVARALPALRALPAAAPGCKLVWARTASGEYPVYVGRGIAGSVLPGADAGRGFLVTDEHVGPLHGMRMRGIEQTITIAAGEEHKTLAAAETVWRSLARHGMGHGDRIVALGGGVVGDLAGFCAATYQRGVAVVQVPTTVVGQVDSAYGGKTGVDLPEAKNYVGAYHQPSAVITDVDTLATLPPEEHAAGYAEVVKTALIAGGSLWERVASGAPVDERIVLDCARTKLAVVAADERDGGLRQVLNLGHTVGHAIETATGYKRYRHGEAVALGLLAALRLSDAGDLRAQVADLLRTAGLPTELDGADPADVVAATKLDKKRRGADVPFVLVRAPGDVCHGQRVEPADVLAAVSELTSPS
jgi:shikimate kinase/3-dehydroquinate synthase